MPCASGATRQHRRYVGPHEAGQCGHQIVPDAGAQRIPRIQRPLRGLPVGGVVPPRHAQLLADRRRVGTPQFQERPREQHPVAVERGRHAGDRIDAAGAQQPQQHRLGLVVTGVGQQHRRRIVFSCRSRQRPVAGVTRRGLHTAAAFPHLHRAQRHRGKPQPFATVRRLPRHPSRARLQTMIDDDRTAAHAQRGAYGARHGRQRHRIASSRTRHQYQWRIRQRIVLAVLGEPSILHPHADAGQGFAYRPHGRTDLTAVRHLTAPADRP